jgi:SAM-dependent methyltransferase
VTELVVAALGPGPGRVLVLGSNDQLVGELAKRGGLVVRADEAGRRGRRRRPDQVTGAPVVAIEGRGPALPFEAGVFDALVSVGGDSDARDLASLRRLVRPGGVLLLVSRVREGVAGGAASLVRRAARSGALPRASDLTAAMLRAGLKPIRQAAVKRSVVPTVVTWGEVRPRPWEERATQPEPR